MILHFLLFKTLHLLNTEEWKTDQNYLALSSMDQDCSSLFAMIAFGVMISDWLCRGEQSLLSQDLTSLGFEVETRSPQQPPQSAAELTGVKLVVLENVAATDFGISGLEAFRL